MGADTRVTRGGATLTARVWQELEAAYRECGVDPGRYLEVSQGSWEGDVDASGSTHDGGGAYDLRTTVLPPYKAEPIVNALRRMGSCAWVRGDGDGMSPHIHGIDRNEDGLSSGARDQVRWYDEGKTGLSSQGKDPNTYRPTQVAYVYRDEEDDVSAEEVWALKTEDPITGESISMRELLKRTRTVATQARDAAREAVELLEADPNGHAWEPDPGDLE